MECRLKGGGVIHYHEQGRGRPFVMLHGTPLDSTAAAYELEPAFRTRRGWWRIYPDLPGHGSSRGHDDLQTIDDYLQVVLDFLNQLLRRRHFVLGGTSWGAYIALGIAHRRPQQVDGLLLAVPMVTRDPRRRRARREPVKLLPDEPLHRAALREGLSWWDDMVVAETPATLEYARALHRTRADPNWLGRLSRGDYTFDHTRWERPFPAPCLFLLGRQDHPFRYQQLWPMLESFPRATFAVLDQAGHLLWGEQRDLAHSLVQDWLDRVERWSPSRPS